LLSGNDLPELTVNPGLGRLAGGKRRRVPSQTRSSQYAITLTQRRNPNL